MKIARTRKINSELLIMTLRIFLDEKSFHCLKQSVPAGSRSKSILMKVDYLNLFGCTAVLNCDEAEARNLLLYANHCPGVVTSINAAFRSAGLTPPDVAAEDLPSPRRHRRVWRPE